MMTKLDSRLGGILPVVFSCCLLSTVYCLLSVFPAQADEALNKGGPPEFKTRTDGLTGLKATYGLTFKSFVPLDTSGPITLAALKDGKVQAADVFTTTPQIITDKLVALADPKFNFAAQNVIPLVYKSAMNATITDTLNAISAKLTTDALLQMDNAVITLHADYATVASAFLKAEGLT